MDTSSVILLFIFFVSIGVGMVFYACRPPRPKRLVFDTIHLKAWTRSYEAVEIIVHSEFLTREKDDCGFRHFARAWKEVASSVVLRFTLQFEHAGEMMHPHVYRLL